MIYGQDTPVLRGDLYTEAFTHSSKQDSALNFERLEFIGDSCIELKVTILLCKKYKKASEGELSRWRSALVSQEVLAELSMGLGLPEKLKAHPAQEASLKNNERIQASLFESYIGALLQQEGLATTFEVIEKLFVKKIEDAKELFLEGDPKTLAQEKIQKEKKLTPVYKKTSQKGPSHNPTFTVELWAGKEKLSEGEGPSIRQAERQAAFLYLNESSKED